jgi:hypothetical protein
MCSLGEGLLIQVGEEAQSLPILLHKLHVLLAGDFLF